MNSSICEVSITDTHKKPTTKVYSSKALPQTSVNEATMKIRQLQEVSEGKVQVNPRQNLFGPEWSIIEKSYKIIKKIKNQIGKNNEQTVLAICRNTQRQVHIKLITDYEGDPQKCRELIRSILIHKHLKHAKQQLVPDLIEQISENGNLFLVFEQFESNLKTVMNQVLRNNFSEELLVSILYNILCNVKKIHSANIILRDIKPENILINENCEVMFAHIDQARSLPSSSIGKGSGNSKRVRDSIYQQQLKNKMNEQQIKNMITIKVNKIKVQQGVSKRCLSPHVGTREYRAPEIQIIEKQYDQASDMWSVGCVLFEMMQILAKQNLKNQIYNDSKQSTLFQGDSSFPLSPLNNTKDRKVNSISDNDSFIDILQKTGQTTENDLCFFQKKSRKFIDEVILKKISYDADQISKLDFQKSFRNQSSELVNILEAMIQVNPFQRASAQEILQNPLFDQIRVTQFEKSPFKKLIIDIDQDEVRDSNNAEQSCEQNKRLNCKLYDIINN